jgi:hypothetical protein
VFVVLKMLVAHIQHVLLGFSNRMFIALSVELFDHFTV